MAKDAMDEQAMDMAAAKAALRAQARTRRATLPPSVRTVRGEAFARHALALIRARLPLPGPVACTWSMPTEPPTDPLIARLQAADIEVVTPRIEGEGDLAWIRTLPSTPLGTGPLGIRTPIGGERVHLADCAVILVPALALDPSGCRLGQGGGYFDRALGAIATQVDGGPLRIGMAYADEVLPDLPAEPHDQGVDLILTETGVTQVRPVAP